MNRAMRTPGRMLARLTRARPFQASLEQPVLEFDIIDFDDTHDSDKVRQL